MNLFFDAAIFIGLIGCGVFCFLAFRKRYRTVAALFLVGWLVLFYGSFLEPRMIGTTYHEVELQTHLNKNLRIALISDTHVGPYKGAEYLAEVVKRINANSPDIILMAGDFVYNDSAQAVELEPLKDLHAALGIYAVLGNHDYGESSWGGRLDPDLTRDETIRATLEQLGIDVLQNESRVIEKNGASFVLLGTDEIFAGLNDLDASVSSISPKALELPRILFSHNPDIVMQASHLDIDLVLAGHTHGGQIRLPFIGPVTPLPDQLGRKYDQGLFSYGSTQLFITRGIGEMGPRARLFAPPEIAILDVRY